MGLLSRAVHPIHCVRNPFLNVEYSAFPFTEMLLPQLNACVIACRKRRLHVKEPDPKKTGLPMLTCVCRDARMSCFMWSAKCRGSLWFPQGCMWFVLFEFCQLGAINKTTVAAGRRKTGGIQGILGGVTPWMQTQVFHVDMPLYTVCFLDSCSSIDWVRTHG